MAIYNNITEKSKKTKDVWLDNSYNSIQYYSVVDKIKYNLKCNNNNYLQNKLDKDKMNAVINYSFYNETVDYYEKNIKTSIIKTIIDRLSSKVIDNNTKLFLNEKEINVLNFSSLTQYIEFDFDELFKQALIYDKICVKVDFKSDKIELTNIAPFEYKLKDDTFEYFFRENGEDYKEVRYTFENNLIINIFKLVKEKWELVEETNLPFLGLMAYEISLNLDLINEAVKELSLVYSKINTFIFIDLNYSQKRIFADKSYFKNGRVMLEEEQFTLLNSPLVNQELKDGEAKPQFQIDDSQMQSYQVKVYKEEIKREIGNILGIDSSSLGLDLETQLATQTRTENSQSAERINQIKNIFSVKINKLLDLLMLDFGANEKLRLEIAPYFNQNRDDITKRAQTLKTSGALDYFQLANELYPEKSEDFKNIYALKRIIKNGEFLTVDENELAIKYGLIQTNQNEGNNAVL